MKLSLLLSLFILFFASSLQAGRITGLVSDENGRLLAYASILVKGTPAGTTANEDGKYILQLNAGNYVLVCQYVGYGRVEKQVTVTAANQVVNFTLSLQQTSMKEVVVTPGGEDPAYEIIRNAIKKRTFYLNQPEEFQCEVYTKGQLKLRSYPKKLFGQDVDFEDGDTSKQKMLYLAESISTYSVQKPGKVKIDVTSTKVSGQSDGFGLSQPQIFSFYENNIQLGANLNPRGFVSPIANNALAYYRYKFEGVFIEDGKEINRIRVIPRQQYEPVFSGYINITENDWRIHSLKLQLTKASQMDLIDTLQIEQLYVPFNNEIWVVKNQVIYPAAKVLGFDAYGSFVNVYSKFDVTPDFVKGFFNSTFLKYGDSSNKRSKAYWDAVRPVPLEVEEILDYKKKDSLEQVRTSPRYLDSIDKKRNKLSLPAILGTGQSFSRERKRATYSFNSLFDALNYNTVEGLVINAEGRYTKRLDSTRNRRSSVFITPQIRYGFSNRHLNGGLTAGYNFGKHYFSTFSVSGGKDVFQFNRSSPITPKNNTINTLIFERNFMKIYEAWYGSVNYYKDAGGGFGFRIDLRYEDRRPLDNTTSYTFRDSEEREFTPNYPVELLKENMKPHGAMITSFGITWQPGARYIEFPESKINIGSKYPTLDISYSKGLSGIFGSDVNFDKWRFIVDGAVNLQLSGTFNYKASVGGFLNRKKVEVPDYQHFNGNQSVFAGTYLNSFQLAPYYRNSTTSDFFTTLNAEHHFNGLLTNKIPLLKKLNWHLVTGTNAFFVNNNSNYFEVFAAFENIFRFFRVDFIQSYSARHKPYSGIKLGLKRGLFFR